MCVVLPGATELTALPQTPSPTATTPHWHSPFTPPVVVVLLAVTEVVMRREATGSVLDLSAKDKRHRIQANLELRSVRVEGN